MPRAVTTSCYSLAVLLVLSLNKLHCTSSKAPSTSADKESFCTEGNQELCSDHKFNLYSQPEKTTMSTSLAVVLYDENKVLPHQKPSREFQLAGQTFTITQNWDSLGVAAVVWDSAVVLAEYLIERKASIAGKIVLELGAGTGLTGMVAASLGADVIITERQEAMDNLKAVIHENTFDKSWKIQAEVLDWTNPLDNSNYPELDIIIGADIVYIEETFHSLLRTITSLANTNKTLVLLSCKIRYDRDLAFLDMLKKYFNITEVLYDKGRDIKVFSAIRHS